MLVRNYRQKVIIHELGLNKNTVSQWMTFLREVMEEWAVHSLSDCWKAYDNLENEGFEYFKVNHSIKFVDQTTGAHTNGIESTWRYAKLFLPAYSRYI